MKVAVKDANILIDLVSGNLVALCLQLPFEFITTEGVLLQLEQEDQQKAVEPFVASGAIKIATLTSGELEAIAGDPLLMKLDVVDLGVMYVAERETAIFLTGDLDLRKESAKKGLRVHGLLWILDQLIQANQITAADAAKRLRRVLAQGAFLPLRDCEERLRKSEGRVRSRTNPKQGSNVVPSGATSAI